MEDALHYFVISTPSGYLSLNGFVDDLEEARAFSTKVQANGEALSINGTVLSQTVSLDELEQSFLEFPALYTTIYTVEEQLALQSICERL